MRATTPRRSLRRFRSLAGYEPAVRIATDGSLIAMAHAPGHAIYVEPGAIHDVRGGVAPAVSIHAYSPPLTRVTYYARDEIGMLRPSHRVESDQPERTDPR